MYTWTAFFVCFPQCSMFRKIGWWEIYCLVVQDPHVFHWLIAATREFKKKPCSKCVEVKSIKSKNQSFLLQGYVQFLFVVYTIPFSKSLYISSMEKQGNLQTRSWSCPMIKNNSFCNDAIGFHQGLVLMSQVVVFQSNRAFPKDGMSAGPISNVPGKMLIDLISSSLDFLKQCSLNQLLFILYGYSFWLVSSAT